MVGRRLQRRVAEAEPAMGEGAWRTLERITGRSVAEAASQEGERLRGLAAIEVRLPCRGGWLRGGSCRWPRPPLAGDRASSQSLPIFFSPPFVARQEMRGVRCPLLIHWFPLSGCGSPSPRPCWAETFEHADPRSRAQGPLLLLARPTRFFWAVFYDSTGPRTIGLDCGLCYGWMTMMIT